MSKRLKKGDEVIVISGNDKGRKGKVLAKSEDRIIVEGINVRKRSVRKSQQQPEGGFISMERPIHISNVRFVGKDEHPTRLRVRTNKDKKKELYYLSKDKKETVHRPLKASK